MKKLSSLSIPPLPSEKRSKPALRCNENLALAVHVTNTDQENEPDIPTEDLDSVSNATKYPSLRSSVRSVSSLPSAASPSITTPMRRSCRVLRYNESIEDFFCLSGGGDPGSTVSSCFSEEYKRLCEEIAHDKDGAANDLKKWNIVLQAASDFVSKIVTRDENRSSNMGQKLIRLHKRAASRFISLDASSVSSSTDMQSLFEIWLSYANAQAKFGPVDAARKTFRHIQYRRLGEKEAKFYISLASFEMQIQNEKSRDVALEVIRDGIEKGAEPEEQLLAYLEQLNAVEKCKEIQSESKSHMSVQDVRPVMKPRNIHQSDQIDGNKSSKVPNLNEMSTLCHEQATKKEIESDENIYLENRPAAMAQSLGPSNASHDQEKYTNKNQVPSGKNIPPTFSLLGKRRKLGGNGPSRGAFGGGAMRISAVSEMDQTVDEDEDEQDEPNSDISYLLNWNPAHGPSTQAAKEAVLAQRATKRKLGLNECLVQANRATSQFRPRMDVIEESAKEHNSSYSATTNSNPSLPSEHNTVSDQYSNNAKPGETSECTHSVKDVKTSSASLCAQASAPSLNASPSDENQNASEDVAKQDSLEGHDPKDEKVDIIKTCRNEDSQSPLTVHPDFQKIVCDRNIIHVNNIPYVKLGVIGKGGSCKVYRTLSRDRNIVAIKKVKIAGMTRKSIEGYANEIALLRRLRGNPAIIQLYDSEVDLHRKAIFLVMEPGEVDLNYVLQQQGKQHGDGQVGTVNMNFIRLTWQQMLSAVQCIHEARIIHGDLKPANFLFVKGVLKLIDFGIAKAIQHDDTTNVHRESQVGTLNYMSPESILDSGKGKSGALMKCGKPSDVWSLGCILYQMCYSKTPFADLQMFPKLQAIVNPNHIIEYPETIDPAAIDAMKLCLKRKPEERAPIVGKNGLLNEHWFLNSNTRNHTSQGTK